jgi:hypothetical protein
MPARPTLAGVFKRLRTESLAAMAVTRDHFITAAWFAEQFGPGIRAADALHVAIAAGYGATYAPSTDALPKPRRHSRLARNFVGA